MAWKKTVKHPKKKPQPELVTTCDQCGKSLNRTCARTDRSGICAAGSGIKVVWASKKVCPAFLCSEKCTTDFLFSASLR